MLGLDALHLLLLAHHAMQCADYVGASPGLFASEQWTIDAEETGFDFLGPLGHDQGEHYWLTSPAGVRVTSVGAIQSLVGATDDHAKRRYWSALDALLSHGFLCRVAIVSDERDRLLYPLHVFGESHQRRLEGLGIVGSIAKATASRAEKSGLSLDEVRFLSDGSKVDDLFIVATRTESPPKVRTVYLPTLIAPTPENLAGLREVAEACEAWR
jgi:hypothetical protein